MQLNWKNYPAATAFVKGIINPPYNIQKAASFREAVEICDSYEIFSQLLDPAVVESEEYRSWLDYVRPLWKQLAR